MILFDTSVLSRVFRRTRLGAEERELAYAVDKLLASEQELGLPGIVLQEILAGVRTASQFTALERQLLASFTIVLPGVKEHIEAARLANKCLRQGVSVSAPDCLIAVLAITGGHTLFTLGEDFTRIAEQTPLVLCHP